MICPAVYSLAIPCVRLFFFMYLHFYSSLQCISPLGQTVFELTFILGGFAPNLCLAVTLGQVEYVPALDPPMIWACFA